MAAGLPGPRELNCESKAAPVADSLGEQIAATHDDAVAYAQAELPVDEALVDEAIIEAAAAEPEAGKAEA